MTHTPEPWKVVGTEIAARQTQDLDAGVVAGMSINYSQPMREANATRIVACVNGCAGLNPTAYRELVDAVADILPAAESALVRMKADGIDDTRNAKAIARVARTRAALDAAEGRAA